jgi:hypothetical protein
MGKELTVDLEQKMIQTKHKFHMVYLLLLLSVLGNKTFLFKKNIHLNNKQEKLASCDSFQLDEAHPSFILSNLCIFVE